MRLRNHFTVGSVYLAVIAVTLCLATLRMGAQGNQAAAPAASPQPSPSAKPFFSLSTNRTYGTSDRARVFINYRGIDHLDFRVYRVKDPVKFFKQLNDPHQMGEAEKTEVAASYQQKPSALEKLRGFKSSIYGSVKNYFRGQLKRESRAAFNEKFRGEGERLALNVADYARVPLLNPDQLIGSFRQMLSPLENEYDTRLVALGKLDPAVYLVEAVNNNLRAYTIAVVTDLTMINKTTSDGAMLIYLVDRRTGEPRSGLNVEVVRGKKTLASGATDHNGLLQTRIAKEQAKPSEEDTPAMNESQVGRDSLLIMASGRDQFAISDLEPFYVEETEIESDEGEGGGGGETEGVTGYIYTDRPVYRPDQKVYFKGILRRLGEKGYESFAARTVRVTVEDPKNGKLIEKTLPLSPRGTFSGDLDIAGGAPLGHYRIIAHVGRETASGYFEVEEYKKPEYKVTVTASKQFVTVGEKAKFTVEARYFFGAPVTNAEVKYYVYRSRYYYWWWRNDDEGDGIDEGDDDEGGGYYGYGNDMVQEGEGKLDAQGRLTVDFQVPPPDEKQPWDFTYRLEAQVTDASRRTVEAKASLIGTRGNIVATAWPERYIYYQGENAKVNVKTADYNGRPVSARVTLKFMEQKYERVEKGEGKDKSYEYKFTERELGSGDVNTNAQGEASYDFRVPIIGSIRIQALVHEGAKEVASNGGYLWAADRNNAWADTAYRDYGSVKLVPDKKSYQPGETAHVLALLPTDKAHLLVTTELLSVMEARRLDSAGRAVMIDVKIEPRYAPNFYLSVAYVKDGEMYSSDKSLAVPARNKFLSLEILPNKDEYKPREAASYTILARNADGSPAAGAEVSLGVVDEAVYSIRPESAPDIRKAFYGRRYNGVRTNFSTAYSFSGYSGDKPVQLAQRRAAYQLADFKNESEYVDPKIVRKDFKDTAYWQPDVVTGADGKATVEVKLPDNLTTWRATARAVTADTRVGSSVRKVVARKDLILRLETPRFLTEGDTVTLSGIVHNYLNEDKATKISIEVIGGRLLDPAEQTVTIAKQGEHRVDWRVAAPEVGQMKLLAKALTNAESDAIEIPLKVEPAGLRQTKGATVTVAEDEAEKTFSVELPADAHPVARSLRLGVSPSIAGTLFGALDYLTGYPYGCTEQTMSQFLPNVIVAQALREVRTTSISENNDLGRKVRRGLDRLYGFQHDDGGWGWWKDDPTDPFMTAYVVDGLTMASGAGFGVETYRLRHGREKLKQMIEAGKAEDGKPIDPETRAYQIYAYNESGEPNAGYLNDLFAHRGELQPYGRALLALALRQRNDDRARQVAGEIERSAKSSDLDAHWESRRRPMLDFTEENELEATALSLKALAQLTPKSPLLPKVARWLVNNRRNGYYWLSTKHTAFAIFGLIEYVKASQELSPDYTVEVYLNGEPVLSRRMTAADSAAPPVVIESKGGGLKGANQVRVVKRGRGVLYLSSTLDYFTKEGEVAAGGSGLKLTREYLRLRVVESGDQAKWSVEPLTGEVHSGDLIVVRLHVQGPRAQYLMIEDPIPAGCEQVERVSGINLDYTEGRWSDWYSAREFRDQKTAFFVNYFRGDSKFQYALRVQVPGQFRVAPARAELMYQPTVQANTANTRMDILEKR